jgi:hypothetical protein
MNKQDKNFHIYVHENSDLIQQGVDENKKTSSSRAIFLGRFKLD